MGVALITNLDTANQPVPGGRHAVSIASFARAANTASYSANDVVSDSTSTAKAIQFPRTGRSGAVIRASMSYAGTDTNAFRLFLFDDEPTNIIDGGAFALVATDMPKIVGVYDFVDADKHLVGSLLNYYIASGSTTAANEVALKTCYATADSKLYGLLVAVTGFTTPVSGAKIVIRLELEYD